MKIILPLLCLHGMALFAQPADSLRARELDEVIVTGQFEPQSVQKSVHRVRVISAEAIQAKGATRLQDVLNTELNIRFSQDLALGSSNISMLGLPGQNVKVLIDGVPVVGRQGTSNAIDINQINVNTIDRVEIIEGPMAVIYGADALAGVINIITKKPEQGKLNGSLRLHEETVGREYGLAEGIRNQHVQADYRMKNLYTGGSFSRNAFGGWQGQAIGRDKEWHPKLQWLGHALAGFDNGKVNAYYRAEWMDETIFDPGLFQGNEAIDRNFVHNRLMHQVQATGKINDRLSFNTALAYTDFSRRIQTSTINSQTGRETLSLAPGSQDVTRFDGTTVRSTLQYKANEWLWLQPGLDINTESGTGARLQPGNNVIADYAAFLSADVKLFKRLNIRPGVRAIRNTAFDAPPAVASANIKYDLNARHDIRLAYGRGFRAPSLRELYFNFFDATHSIEGNPHLEAELSHSYSAAWTWRLYKKPQAQAVSSLNVFYNDIDNMISFGVRPGTTNTTFINIEKFKSQGVAWNGRLQWKRNEINFGYAYTGRYNRLTEADPTLPHFTWTGELTGNLMHTFPRWGLTATINYKYTGKMPFYEMIFEGTEPSVRLAQMDGFHWADASLQKTLRKNIVAALGVRNGFDVQRINSTSAAAGAHTATGPRPIGYGRSYYATLTYTLNK